METIIDQSNDVFRDSAADMLRTLHSLARTRKHRWAKNQIDRTVWQAMSEAGWFSIAVPEAEGGLGLGVGSVAAVAEEVGKSLLTEPYLQGGLHAVTVLSACEQSSLSRRLLTGLRAGDLICPLAWQEIESSLDIEPIETTATREERVIVRGRKRFVGMSGAVDGWIVSAAMQGDYCLIWVPRDAGGVVVKEFACVDGSLQSELNFTDVSVPLDHLLARGQAALDALARGNNVMRVAVAAELVGVAKRAIGITLEHLRNRQQFGKPLGTFQVLRHKIVDAWIQQELAAACVIEASKLLDSDACDLHASVAARAKARATSAALAATRTGIQLHGAMGYTDEADIGLYFKRALRLSAWLGNATQNRELFARHKPPAIQKTLDAEAVADFPREADWNTMPDAEFRHMVRSFFKAKYPDAMRNIARRVHWAEIKEWYLTLSRQGWVAPGWPKEFGGMGLSPDKLLSYVDEQERYGVARAPDMGVVMIGPLLIKRGTPEQQRKYLPEILKGHHVWCQGYSEPGAGSDLASLRTEAMLEGESFVVNGQKIWTTLAQDATHMFALVRTDKNVKKQEGISFLLIDLTTPGITIRPIRDLGGDEEFCEVFFDQVEVPVENLVGRLNEGWSIAKELLGFERIFLGSPKQSRFALGQLESMAQEHGLRSDPVFNARHTELELDVADLADAYAFFADIVKRGEVLPPSVSMLKVWASDTYQRITTYLVECADEEGAIMVAPGYEKCSDYPALLISSLPSTIYGGSAEIQREILARNVLDLPG